MQCVDVVRGKSVDQLTSYLVKLCHQENDKYMMYHSSAWRGLSYGHN